MTESEQGDQNEFRTAPFTPSSWSEGGPLPPGLQGFDAALLSGMAQKSLEFEDVFAESEDLRRRFAPYIAALPHIIGEARLVEPATIPGMMQIKADICDRIATNLEQTGQAEFTMDPEYLAGLQEELEDDEDPDESGDYGSPLSILRHRSETLRSLAEVFVRHGDPSEFHFTPDSKTYAMLFRASPGQFLPEFLR